VITRRELLQLAGVGSASAVFPTGDGCSRMSLMSGELAPWHMWGTSETMALSGTAAEFKGKQLVKINYARPENWRFFLAVQLDTPLAALDTLEIDFDLIIGVGRSNVQILNFAVFTFAGPVGSGTILWRTKDTSPEANELVVAQDVQMSARMRGSFDPALTKIATATAFFAPNVHIRPEWFSSDPDDVARFRGDENGGT
jgi:hypothetical protein